MSYRKYSNETVYIVSTGDPRQLLLTQATYAAAP